MKNRKRKVADEAHEYCSTGGRSHDKHLEKARSPYRVAGRQQPSGAPVKITILHHAESGCVLTMDDAARLRFEILGSKALGILEKQDPLLWAHAADTGFLKLIKRGAGVLQDFGAYTVIGLEDGHAHQAFITCCLLALRVEDLRLRDTRTLREALCVLSECCTVQVNPVIVPPLGTAPRKVKDMPRMTKAYERMVDNKPVSLADLLRLLKILEASLSPTFVPLACDLRIVTEGLRKALEQTKKKRRRDR